MTLTIKAIIASRLICCCTAQWMDEMKARVALCRLSQCFSSQKRLEKEDDRLAEQGIASILGIW